MSKKISFPMGNGKVENGYYNPTSIPQAIQQKRNRKKVAKKQRLAKAGIVCEMKDTRAKEPVQSAAFKRGYRNS